MSKHANIGFIISNPRHTFGAAKIISYATEESDTQIKVTGLVAGDQMRRTCVRRHMCHEEIRNFELMRIVGERSKDPLVQAFLSLPAADDSVCAEGEYSPPAAQGHNLRVDLMESSWSHHGVTWTPWPSPDMF